MARRRRLGWILRVAVVSWLVQLPMGATLAALLWPLAPALALAALASMAAWNAPLVQWVRGGIDDRLRSRAWLWGVELPFYLLWGTSFLYAPSALLFFLANSSWSLVTDHQAFQRLPALGLILAICFMVTCYAAFVRRARQIVTRTEVHVRGLSPALDGYTIVQLSDLHIGGLTPPSRGRRWVERASALGADLAVVTGDLVAHGDAFVDATGDVLAGLRAPDGVFACMGNHDYFCDDARLARALERAGVELLRNEGRLVSPRGAGAAPFFVAGVDDTWSRRDDLARTLRARPEDAVSILLAHDPNVFPDAAARGVTLTLSGHTHGGQVALPFGARRFNLARLATPFTSGLYRLGSSVLYVHRGNGTTGPPLRLGAAPEIALLVLRAGST